MNQKIDTAVILAAGMGSRLGPLKRELPKSFLKIGEETLIERSIRLLQEREISRIIIGTGFGNNYFDALISTHPNIITFKNPIFENSGSMYTLYLLRKLIDGPFLLLEGDLLYESAALNHALESEMENTILASSATKSGDEVYIQCSKEGLLVQMSKDLSLLDHVNGELIGINKISEITLDSMNLFAEKFYTKNDFSMHYEDALVGVSNELSLHVEIINDLAWCEIDDESHLKRAVSIVYPKILERSYPGYTDIQPDL